MTQKIVLESVFGSNLSVRSTITTMFNQIRKIPDDDIILDFNNVDFISRSCADEYLKQSEKLNKNIIAKNMAPDIQTMITVVRRAKRITKPTSDNHPKVVLI